MSSAICFNLKQSKLLSSGNELTHYQTTNFRPLPKLKEFADNNFKIDGNGSKLSKRVENTVGNGEIARNEQFLLFPQCFLPVWKTFCHFPQISNCRLQTLSDKKCLKFVVW